MNPIKWNNHKEEIFKEQQYLFDNNLECDCILISAQGDRIQTHQVVLSSSSEFFRHILSELPPTVEAPTIYIPDIETSVLEAIVKFIYTGVTNVSSTYLATLLESCEFLHIKGCVANGFTLKGSSLKIEHNAQRNAAVRETIKKYNNSESWSSEEYLIVAQIESANSEGEEEATEPNYIEEYLDDDGFIDIKDEQMLIDTQQQEGNDDDDNDDDVGDDDEDSRQEAGVSHSNEFIAFEIEKSTEDESIALKTAKDNIVKHETFKRNRSTVNRSSNSQIDKALNEVNNGKTIHRLSVEYNLPRSTLYHRFRNNENLKQNYRLERKSALDNAVRAVLNERLSLKVAADRYKVPKTAIWREVRKCEQYQPSNKEITEERQSAQSEIISGKSLTSISAKYGIPLTTLHRDKKKLSIEGKLPESFRVKDRTENSEYGQRLEMALKKCRSGMSQYQAAKLYDIPKATMWRYANALNKSSKKSK